jgi:hypothetical protein
VRPSAGNATAPVFARAVERIDDPYPIRNEAFGAVPPFFGQDRVVGPRARELAHDQVVRLAIAFALEHAAVGAGRDELVA